MRRRAAYLCRYLHSPLSEVLSLTPEDAEGFEVAVGGIVQRENDAK